MKCYLENRCEESHKKATSKMYTQKFYRVGRLFGGRAVCLWCLFHLQDLVKPVLTENDARELEGLKKRFPEYWKIIQEEGEDTVRHELKMQWLEAEPSSLPTRPEQLYPKLKVTVDGIGGE